MPLKSFIEIHDSTLAGVEGAAHMITIRLTPAYVHLWESESGIEPGSGCTQDLDIVIFGGVVDSSPSALPVRLWDGSLSVGETHWDNLIPLRLAARDVVSFVAVTTDDQQLNIRGLGVEIMRHGELRFVEKLPWPADVS